MERDLKRLLEILNEHFHEDKFRCFCDALESLWWGELINSAEKRLLREHIYRHVVRSDRFLFEPWDREYRFEWLEAEIAKL